MSIDHLKESFPDHKIVVSNDLEPPYKLKFCDLSKENTEKKILVTSGKFTKIGPYSFQKKKRNQVKFTPTQIEAIKSGMQPGLSLIVGPPGTGKTDVAVQIISNIYHNFPNQKTLIVTHSNQALNQLFEKIINLDIDERHLLRLGHGEEMLDTEKDFSRYGRVNYVLGKRLELLDEVDRLQRTLQESSFETASYSCETAIHFYFNVVLPKWNLFQNQINEKRDDNNSISIFFPFKAFFSDLQPLFKNSKFEEDYETAKGSYVLKTYYSIMNF